MAFKEIYVPATTANLGPGYDFLGMALGFGNRIRYSLNDSGHHIISVAGEGITSLKCDASNMIIRSCEHVFSRLSKKMPEGISVETINEIPVGRGLGSSASAIVAGVVMAGDLAEENFGPEEIFMYAAEIEGHPDNVAPVVYGGMTICHTDDAGAFYARKLGIEAGFCVVLAIPQFQLPTAESRKVLPKTFSVEDITYNSSNIALLIDVLHTQDYSLLATAMRDKLHQPYRSRLIPGCSAVFTSAMNAGAYGVFLSGAGPTIASFASNEAAEAVGSAMQSAFRSHGMDSIIKLTHMDESGVRYVTKEQ